MKNLLLLTTLLTNPLNSLIIQPPEGGDDNKTQIDFYYEQDAHTNCANYTNTESILFKDDENRPGYKTTTQQKWSGTTELNEYIDIKMYNYCNLATYKAYNSDYGYYDYIIDQQTFFVIEITPYNRLNNNTLSIELNLRLNIVDPADMNDIEFWYQTGQYRYFQTDNNLGNYLNSNNWAYENSATDYYNNVNSYVGNNKQTLLNEFSPTRKETMNPFAVLDQYEYLPAKAINLTTATTYIYGKFELSTISNTTEQDNYDALQTPNSLTKLLHIDNITIIGEEVEIPPTEIIDIPGLIYTIITLPFTFLSQAFDLTLFPGTPYTVNISNLLMGFIAIAMLLWVLKLILGRADLGQWLQDTRQRNDLRKARNKAGIRTYNEREYKKIERSKNINND